jgi:general L-amino acid transport system substrate-binding protein
VLARLAAALLLAAGSFAAQAGQTLDGVKARGYLRCGVSEGIAGFSEKDAAGRWRGLDADFCRAVAAAVVGDAEKVRFVPLKASNRFPALQAGTIDLLVRNTSWTFPREVMLRARFPAVLFHDGQGFMVPASSADRKPADLAGAKICVEKGTTHQQNLADWLAVRNLRADLLVIDSAAGAAGALFSGQCAAYTSDASQLAAARLRAPGGPHGWAILAERISREPLAPAVLAGDEEWFLLVRWVLYAQIAAEEAGITRANVEQTVRQTRDTGLRRLTGGESGYGKALGVAEDWAVRAIAAVGNYGEMFERNLGRDSPLKMERGLNRLWTEGGLMIAPPLR